jgi:hypothetical protein
MFAVISAKAGVEVPGAACLPTGSEMDFRLRGNDGLVN